jgi:superfamily II DNA or RNA helicase
MSKIEGVNLLQLKQLRDITSYKINPKASYFARDYTGGKRYLMSKRGEFPSGLLYLVRDYLSEQGLEHLELDKRICPKTHIDALGQFNFDRSGIIPYPEQQKAVDMIIRNGGTGCIEMPTGCGKSVAMVCLIARLKVKTLLIVPNLGLKFQLTETLTKHFGIDLVGPGKAINVQNIDSTSLTTDTNYDLLIIDEAHHSAAATYRRLNKTAWKGIYYRAFFTATAFRSKEEEQLLFESIAGPLVYRVDYKTAISKRYIVPVEAFYIELPKTNVTGDETWASVYSQLVVNNNRRNMIIANLLMKLHYANVPTLCLLKEIAHGNAIESLTKFHFMKGENDNNQEILASFNSREINCLIGTTGVLGEGIDTKPAEYIIISGLGKSKNQFMQAVGRGLRVCPGKKSCKVILFKDLSHRWTKAHYAAQVKILRDEYDMSPVKLEVTTDTASNVDFLK